MSAIAILPLRDQTKNLLKAMHNGFTVGDVLYTLSFMEINRKERAIIALAAALNYPNKKQRLTILDLLTVRLRED